LVSAIDSLALQVGLVDLVELRDPERADAGRGQVEQGRAAEAAGADDEHLGVLQPLLAAHPDVGDDQVPAVAADLVDAQLGRGLDERGQGCGHGLFLRTDVDDAGWIDSRDNAAARPVCSPPSSRRRAVRRDMSRHPVTARPWVGSPA
jgi:hypothetical protein